MLSVMSGDRGAVPAARAGVQATAVAEPGRLRRCSATGLLALLSAAALAPLAVAGGQTPVTAVVSLVGGVGSNVLASVIEKAVSRLRDGRVMASEPDVLRDAVAADLLTALEKGDSAARELRSGLTDLLLQIGGMEAAVDATGGEVRAHLQACFGTLLAAQGEALEKLRAIDVGQRRQERRLREQGRQIDEMIERLRLVTRLLAERHSEANPRPAQPLAGLPAAAIQIAAPARGSAVNASLWDAGAEIMIGECVYLLHGDLLEERFSADQSVLFRQGRGLRLVPDGREGPEYVWLRQVEIRRPSMASKIALAALTEERDLLVRLRSVTGLPQVRQLAAGGRTATLALGWPASRSLGGPCESLQGMAERGGASMDPWRMFRLFKGLAGLCVTLSRLHGAGTAHRFLTPAVIIVLDEGRLVLRDTGLAARDYEPGEGPAYYKAPEQHGGGKDRPGPQTDVYQLAVIAYHLVSGHLPHPKAALPLRAQARDVPAQISDGLAAALADDPGMRPGIRFLGDLFRTACDELS